MSLETSLNKSRLIETGLESIQRQFWPLRSVLQIHNDLSINNRKKQLSFNVPLWSNSKECAISSSIFFMNGI